MWEEGRKLSMRRTRGACGHSYFRFVKSRIEGQRLSDEDMGLSRKYGLWSIGKKRRLKNSLQRGLFHRAFSIKLNDALLAAYRWRLLAFILKQLILEVPILKCKRDEAHLMVN